MNIFIYEILYRNPEIAGMIFFDGVDLAHRKYQDIDQEEPGYFRAIVSTFIQELLRPKSPKITVDYLQALHKSCLTGIPNFKDAGELKPVSYFGTEIDLVPDADLRGHFYKTILADPDYQREFYKIFFMDDEENELLLQPKLLVNVPPNCRMYFKSAGNRNILPDLEEIIADYYAIAANAKVDEKLRNLLKFIQRLERRHPFRDGNCRLFCMLLLNLELIKLGHFPTLQNNPNFFDWMPIAELMEQVMQGQVRFLNYLETKNKNIQFINAKNEPVLVKPEYWFYDTRHGKDCLLLLANYEQAGIIKPARHTMYHVIYAIKNLPYNDGEILFREYNEFYLENASCDELINIWYKLLEDRYQEYFLNCIKQNPEKLPENINFNNLIFFLETIEENFIKYHWHKIHKVLLDLEAHQFFALFRVLSKQYHKQFLSCINPDIYSQVGVFSMPLHLNFIFKYLAQDTYEIFFHPIKENIIEYLKTYQASIPFDKQQGKLLYNFVFNDLKFSGWSAVEIRAVFFKLVSTKLQRALMLQNSVSLRLLASNAARFDLVASVLDNAVKHEFYALLKDKIYNLKLVASTFYLIASHISKDEIASLFTHNLENISASILTIDNLDRLCSVLTKEQIAQLRKNHPKPYVANVDSLFLARNIPLSWRQELVPKNYSKSSRQVFFAQHQNSLVPKVTISLPKLKID